MKNWTIKEAVDCIHEGTDFAGMKEIGSFNPLFFKYVCENDVAGITGLMGDKFTLRRLSKEISDVNPVEKVEETETEGTEGTERTERTEVVTSNKDLESMTTKELIAECDARGIKVPKYGKNKAFYLDALLGSSDEEEEEVTNEDPYAGKNAMALFKMCKDRGIKVAPRQKAKVYIDLLTAADSNVDKDDDIEDDWADEVVEEEQATKSKVEEIDDEDWDI